MKILYILLLISLLIPSLVLANQFVKSEANAGLNLPGGNGFTGHSSNRVNPFSNITYTQCSIPAGLYQPVVYNFTDNQIISVMIVTAPRTIQIYDSQCQLTHEINLPTTQVIQHMPVLENFNGNGQQEYIFLGNESLNAYEYNSSTDNFERVWNITIEPTTWDIASLDHVWLSCANEGNDNYCVAFKEGASEMLIFNVTDTENPSVTQSPQTVKTNWDYLGGHEYFNGIVASHTIGATHAVIPFCFQNGGNAIMSCTFFNMTGNNTGTSFDYTPNSGSAAIRKVTQLSAFIANLGSLKRVFITLRYNLNGVVNNGGAYIYDLAGNELFDISPVSKQNFTSNWMVGDFQKGGTNWACLLVEDNGAETFQCYDDTFTKVWNVNLSVTNTTDINVTPSAVMADFDSNNSFMGFSTKEGIFMYNTSGNTFYPIFTTGLVFSTTNNKSTMVTSFSRLPTSSPAVFYMDSTQGFIISNSEILVSCGDSICQDSENDFTCPQDCAWNATGTSNATGYPCIEDSHCASGYCENGYCMTQLAGGVCNENSDCISGNCINGKCTKPSWFQSLDAAKDSTAGDDEATNNGLALLIMIICAAVPLLVSRSVYSIIASLVLFLAMGIFFTAYAQWLSGFILFGIFLSYLVGAVGVIILFKSGE